MKTLAFLLLIIPTFAFATESINGIWQDEQSAESYYSIHQNGNTVILIDLSRLAFGGITLSSSYIGSTEDFILRQMANFPSHPEFDFSLSLRIISDKEAILGPLVTETTGELVDPFRIKLIKIFSDQ